MEKIREFMYEASAYQLLQCGFRHAVDIHGIPGYEMSEAFDLLGCAGWIRAKQCLHPVLILDYSISSADRTFVRYLNVVGSCQVL